MISIKCSFLLLGTNLGPRFRSSRWCWGISWFVKLKTAGLSKVLLPVIFCILFPLVRFWYFSIWWFLFLTYSFYFDSLRTGLKQLWQSTEEKVYSYDKDTSFVILNNKDAIQKIEEQIRESVVSNTDPRSPLPSKI